MKKIRNGFAIALVGAVALTACGGDDDKSTTTTAVSTEATTADGTTAEGTTADATTAEGTTAEGTTAEGTMAEGSDGAAAGDARQQFIDQLVATGIAQDTAECIADTLIPEVGEEMVTATSVSAEEAQELATKIAEATTACQAG